MTVLILGYGNPLRGDDGVGWVVAEQLADAIPHDEVEVQVHQQLTPDLAEPVSRAKRVLFIDACACGGKARFSLEPVEPGQLTPGGLSHHVDPAVLLAWSRALYGSAPQAQVLVVNGISFGYGQELSAAVTALLPQVVECARRWCENAFALRKNDCEYNG